MKNKINKLEKTMRFLNGAINFAVNGIMILLLAYSGRYAFLAIQQDELASTIFFFTAVAVIALTGLLVNWLVYMKVQENREREGRELWIVCRNIDYQKDKYQVQGIFDCEKAAANACYDDSWWIAPIKMNERLPRHGFQEPRAYYPITITE